MNINKKILLIVFTMLGVLSISIVSNVGINIKKFGQKTTIDRAQSIAEAVRDGLTAHMSLGAMDKSTEFLANMIHHQNVKELRIVRSPKLIEQYGAGSNDPYTYDDIEKEVLTKSLSITKEFQENGSHYVRVTIPYIASKESTPNCLDCHSNVKAGDVLGAITLELSNEEVHDATHNATVNIISISLLFLLFSFALAIYLIRPYIKLFNDLEEGISKAYRGDFTHQVDTKLENEAGIVAKRLNDLSEIFKFKKTIELDATKDDIYRRIAYILEENFSIEKFVIFENYASNRHRKVVYKSALMSTTPNGVLEKSKTDCRAYRTSLNVASTDFHEICLLCHRKNEYSYCMPFSISDEFSLTLLCYCDTQEQLQTIKENMSIITNYFELAVPVLQTKLLLNKLQETSLKDPMTHLYNRRYLEKYIEEELHTGVGFSIMMIDIDFFKQVNDTYGHDVGDDVIIALADVLKNNTKGSDIAIRFGGEEFLVLTLNTTSENAYKIAESIHQEFKKLTFQVQKASFSKSLSIGIASYPRDGASAWQIIKYADIALYKAKESGRDKVMLFDKSMYTEEQI